MLHIYVAEVEESIKVQTITGPNFLYRAWLLVIRTMLEKIREPMETHARLAQTIFLALLVGVLYYDVSESCNYSILLFCSPFFAPFLTCHLL